MGEPTTRTGNLRRSGNHYVDVIPPIAIIHSKPLEVSLTKAKEVAHKITNLKGIMPNFINIFDKFDAYRTEIGRKIYGGILH
jgi:hypothetical protein